LDGLTVHEHLEPPSERTSSWIVGGLPTTLRSDLKNSLPNEAELYLFVCPPTHDVRRMK
jgi:hypothetical protein